MSKITARTAQILANSGSILDRMEAIARSQGMITESAKCMLIKTVVTLWGNRPQGIDALETDIGCSILHALINEDNWSDEDLAEIAWGIPLDSLEVYKKQHLRLVNKE